MARSLLDLGATDFQRFIRAFSGAYRLEAPMRFTRVI